LGAGFLFICSSASADSDIAAKIDTNEKEITKRFDLIIPLAPQPELTTMVSLLLTMSLPLTTSVAVASVTISVAPTAAFLKARVHVVMMRP
jgi:hypothetical protein